MTDSASSDQASTASAPIAFVTGGTRGIGLACARALQTDGFTVVVGGRSEPDRLDEGLIFVRCDVTSGESVDTAFDEIEQRCGAAPSVVVANAGITIDKLTLRMTEADFAAVVDANLTGAFRVAKRAVKPMMRARSGRIIFMSSVVAAIGQIGQANYAASKAGLIGLARSMAREFASRNICVNVVAPGPIDTDMLAAISDAAREAMVGAVPLGRVGRPEDIAAAVSFLASPGASYITGATLPVDGGLGMGGA